MQQIAAAAWSPASDRKIYLVWIGVVWVAILAGFGLDFARYQGEAPPPPWWIKRGRLLIRTTHRSFSHSNLRR